MAAKSRVSWKAVGDLQAKIEDLKSRRADVQAAFEAAEADHRRELGLAEIGEGSKAKVSSTREARREAKARLVALDAAQQEIADRLATAEKEYADRRKAELIRDIEEGLARCRAVVAEVLAIEEKAAPLIESFSSGIEAIMEANRQYVLLCGAAAGNLPDLCSEINSALPNSPNGDARGVTEIIQKLWRDRIQIVSRELFRVSMDDDHDPIQAAREVKELLLDPIAEILGGLIQAVPPAVQGSIERQESEGSE